MAGIFTQLGIDMRNEEQILADRSQQMQQEAAAAFQNRPERFQGENASERAGMMIGTGLGQAAGDAGLIRHMLTPAQQRQIEVQQAAEARFNKALKVDPNLAGDKEMKALEQQRILGEEMVRMGDVRGFEVLNAANAAKVQLRSDRVNREQIAATTRRTEQITDRFETTKIREDLLWKRGESKQVWRRGDKDPNNGFVAYQQPDGTFIDSNGQAYTSADITTYRPSDNQLQGTRGTGVTSSELKELRGMMTATGKQARGAVRMKRAIEDSVNANGFVSVLDGTGSISQAVVKTLDVVTGIANQVESALAPEDRAAGIYTGKWAGKNLQSRGNSIAYANENLKVLDSLAVEQGVWDMIPKNIRDDDRARTEYYATLSQLVYARARANEPGARQLSDNDYKNAMMAMAGSTNDPEAWRRTMLGNIQEDVASVQQAYDLLPNVIKERGMVLGPKGFETWTNDINTFYDEFGVGFGTAADPSTELTNPRATNPTAPTDDQRPPEFSEVTGSGTEDDPIVIGAPGG